MKDGKRPDRVVKAEHIIQHGAVCDYCGRLLQKRHRSGKEGCLYNRARRAYALPDGRLFCNKYCMRNQIDKESILLVEVCLLRPPMAGNMYSIVFGGEDEYTGLGLA